MAKYYKEDNTIAISTVGMEPELLTYLQLMKTKGDRSDWVRRAISFRYEHDFYKKGFLLRLVQENYTLCKHLLRQVGAALKLGN